MVSFPLIFGVSLFWTTRVRWDGLDIIDHSVYSSMVTGPQGLLGVIFPQGFNPIFSLCSVAMLQRNSSSI